MRMRWYCKEFVNAFGVSTTKKVPAFLNTLNDIGVLPEHIKVVGMNSNWLVVYYYFNREIE